MATKFDFDSLVDVVALSSVSESADASDELELEFELLDGSAPQPKTVSNESNESNESMATEFRVNFKCVCITKSD